MGIGQRIVQAFSRGQAPDEDPDAVREAGVVLLAEGPILVALLRDRGIDATGLESVDPVTEVRSFMRIMVRQSDLAAARQVLSEEKAQTVGGDALDAMAAGDDEAAAAAEEASQRAMGQLFVAADRLAGRPGDAALLLDVDALGAEVADGPPPFGVEPLAWARVASLAEAVLAAADGNGGGGETSRDDDVDEDDLDEDEVGEDGEDGVLVDTVVGEDGVQSAASALRDFLRQYV